MKTNHTIRTLLFLLLLFAATSCRNTTVDNLMDSIPADADVVFVGRLNTIIESLDGKIEDSEITLPSEITSLLGSDQQSKFEDKMEMLKHSGINLDACALVYNYKDQIPFLVVNLNDDDRFVRTINSEDYDEDKEVDGLTIYEKDEDGTKSYIGVKGNVAYILPEVRNEDFKPKKFFSKLLASADRKPFSETGMASYITEGNMGGLSIRIAEPLIEEFERDGLPSDLAEMCKGFVCCRGNLNDNAANITLKMFDEEGNPAKAENFRKSINPDATINAEALKYLHKNENIIYAVSLKDFDWDDLNAITESARFSEDDQTAFILIRSYLERIDGTMALGVGFREGMNSITRIGEGACIDDEMAVTAVIEVRKGKAESIINDIKVLLDNQGMPYDNKAEGFAISIPKGGGNGNLMTINVEKRNDMIIISNRQIAKDNNKLVAGIDFTDKNMVLALNLPKGNNFLEDYDISDRIRLSIFSTLKNMELEMNLEIGEKGDGGVLWKIFRIFSKIDKMEQERRASSYDYEVYDADEYDYSAYEDVIEEDYDEFPQM